MLKLLYYEATNLLMQHNLTGSLDKYSASILDLDAQDRKMGES